MRADLRAEADAATGTNVIAVHTVTHTCYPVEKFVHAAPSPYDAAKDAHAIVVLTEWDEFKGLELFMALLI